MHKLFTILLLAAIVAYVNAAAAIYPPEKKPAEFADQEGCYLKSLNLVLPYNEPYYPEGKCEQFTCGTNNYTQYVSCGVIGVQPGCRVVRDLTQKYPGCCGKPVCDPTTTTETPITDAPITDAPITDAPITYTPITDAPITDIPVTDAPTTPEPSCNGGQW